MGHSVKQEQPRAYPAISPFFDRNSTFAVTDFQQRSYQFEEGEFDRGAIFANFSSPASFSRQRVCFAPRLRSRCALNWNISLGVFDG
jgi:hypothetical protein